MRWLSARHGDTDKKEREQCNWRDPSRVQDGGSQQATVLCARTLLREALAWWKLPSQACKREKQTEDHRLRKFLLVDSREAVKVGEARSIQWVQKKPIKPEIDMDTSLVHASEKERMGSRCVRPESTQSPCGHHKDRRQPRGRPGWTRIDTLCVTPCISVWIMRNFVGTMRELQSRHSSAARRAQVLSRMRDGQAKGDVFYDTTTMPKSPSRRDVQRQKQKQSSRSSSGSCPHAP